MPQATCLEPGLMLELAVAELLLLPLLSSDYILSLQIKALGGRQGEEGLQLQRFRKTLGQLRPAARQGHKSIELFETHQGPAAMLLL